MAVSAHIVIVYPVLFRFSKIKTKECMDSTM